MLHVDPESEFMKLLKESNVEIQSEKQLAELNKFLLYKRPRAKRPLIPRSVETSDSEEETTSSSEEESEEESSGELAPTKKEDSKGDEVKAGSD